MNWARVFPVFSIAFAVLYVVVLLNNYALITYHPALGEWEWLAAKPKAGPAMYWYGQLATSTLGAAIIAAIATVLPPRWSARLWSGWTWVVPAAAILTIAFVLRGYFIR